MAELNKVMADVQTESIKIKRMLKALLIKYDSLYRDGNKQFIHERVSSNGAMEGLEDFQRLTMIFKRNKDVVASLVRGIDNLRSIKGFQFVEEDVPPPRIGTKKRKKKESPKIESMEFDSVSDILDPETIEVEDIEKNPTELSPEEK